MSRIRVIHNHRTYYVGMRDGQARRIEVAKNNGVRQEFWRWYYNVSPLVGRIVDLAKMADAALRSSGQSASGKNPEAVG